MLGPLIDLRRTSRRLLSAALLLALMACATAPVDYSVNDLPVLAKPLGYQLKTATVALAEVEELDQRAWAVSYYVQVPLLFRRGLNQTLATVRAFDPAASKSATLAVSITKFDLPEESAAKSTAIHAIYRLVDVESGALIIEKSIETAAEVPASFAFSGGQRRQEAINQAIKANIRQFVAELRGYAGR